jgi:poly(3-hydroxybutyrate) depolymerase
MKKLILSILMIQDSGLKNLSALNEIVKFSRSIYSITGITSQFLFTALSIFLLSFSSEAQMTTLNVGGTSRSLLVYAPADIPQNRPLVISMHGLNQDINYQKGQAKWELVADTAKFVVVYPAGISNSWDINGTRDTDFILAIIESMASRYKIDRNRVYVSGFSMGGMMSYHTANKIADKVAAIGPVSGYLFGNNVSSSRPMPIIHVHGTADDVVHYEPYSNQQGVLAMLEKWRNWNKCPSTGTRIDPYPANKPTSNAYLNYWGPCDRSAVTLISLKGKGHWHSNDPAGVHTTIEIWNFVKKYSLASQSSPTVIITAPANNAVFTSPATVNISASAADPDGTVTKVEFYNGSAKIGEDANAPYTYSWTNVAAGKYNLTAIATDNSGNKTTSSVITVNVNVPQGPYNGTPHQIPGLIEAEHYDAGGEGSAYHEADENGNQGGATLRNDQVDIEITKDTEGSYNIGYILNGEWLEYTVNVSSAARYDVAIRVACNGTGKKMHLEIDGKDISGPVSIPNTADWQKWETITIPGLELGAGNHVLRLAADADYFNINYLRFDKAIVTSFDDAYQSQHSALDTELVYPNPSENTFTINFSGTYKYQLLDLAGKVVAGGVSEGRTIAGTELTRGIYVLEIQNEQGSRTVRLVRQ